MANNPEFEDPELVKEAKQKAANAVKNTVAEPVNKLKRVIIRKVLKWAGILLLVFLPIIIIMQPVQDIVNAARAIFEGAVGAISKIFDSDGYDEEVRSAWNNGGDPDGTYLLYEKLNEQYKKTHSLSGEDEDAAGLSEELDEDATELSEELKEELDDAMRNEHLFLGPEDILNLLKSCYEYNDKMFQKNTIYYGYKEWRLERRTMPVTGEFINFEWENADSGPDNNTTDDGVYGIITEEAIRGEEINGEKVYTVHWPEIMAMAYYYSEEKMDDEDNGWGTDPDSEYDPNDGNEYEINSVKDYYLNSADRKKVTDLFEYTFVNRFNAVEEDGHSSKFQFNSMSSNPQVAYRYSRTPDPTDWGPFYEDPPHYDGEYPAITRFAPDSAPDYIYNYFEAYKYEYCSTYDVPGYIPDPENYTPPEGEYCIGKWRIVDPQPFIDEMSLMCPHYRDRDSEDMREQLDYDWAAEMIEHFVFYLDYFYESFSGTGVIRSDYYTHLAELYSAKQIEIYYYGMKPKDSEVEEFLAWVAEQYPGKTIAFVNYDNAVGYGEFYEVSEDDPKSQARNGTIPFASYGVTFPYGSDPSTDEFVQGRESIHRQYTGDVFISEYTPRGYYVNSYISLVEGADETLDGGFYYTRDEVEIMFQKLANSKTKEFKWLACVDDVAEYSQANGYDVAALLAIILTEYSPKIGVSSYNWYNLTASSGQSIYKTSASSKWNWWNPKEQFSTTYASMENRYGSNGYHTLEGCCMVECMDSIVRRYWKSSSYKQNTYFRMTFNQYGWDLDGNTYYPQNWDEAVVEEAHMDNVAKHCYCPWWDDIGFRDTGFNGDYIWCNKCAVNRQIFRKALGY